MRILHVTDTFLPRLGGIELHVADTAVRQQARGHQVAVLTAERMPARAPGAVGYDDLRVIRLRNGITGGGLRGVVRRALADVEPDVIHAHLTVGSPFGWAVLRTAARPPLVATMHSLLPARPRLVRAGIRIAGLPTDRITFTAVSEVAAERLRPALPPGRSVGVLHNGVDPADWRIEHRPPDAFTILMVGRLAARKRPLALVGALADLAADDPDLAWRAVIVGDGAQRSTVAASIAAHGLTDRVRMTGAIARSDIRALLATASVLVAPATLESFGIAALEARCAGVPIVAMATSGVTEFLVDGVDGLLARDDADIAQCLRRLAREPRLAATIRRHNTSTPVSMEWTTVLDEHDLVYDRALRRTSVSVAGGRQPDLEPGAAEV
jgi:glycosyltransferase involved in cell wall biosynthesis